MKTILVSSLALGALTTAATAEPVTPPPATPGPVALTDAQMDGVTAGRSTALSRFVVVDLPEIAIITQFDESEIEPMGR